jgi:hypothetical protein
MLTEKEKELFTIVVKKAESLSDCEKKQGAVIISEESPGTIFFGFNKPITKDHEQSAVVDVLLNVLSEKELIMFVTYFPSIEDFKLIVAKRVAVLYLLGEVNNAGTVKFINDLVALGSNLVLIKLEVGKNVYNQV